MPAYEYSVIPAPNRGEKARGAKTGADRFALALTATLNDMAADGWEYVRAETLPSEERAGLTGRATVYHNVLVFRRSLGAEELPAQPTYTARVEPIPQLAPAQPEPQPLAEEHEDLPADAPTRPFSEPMRSKPLAAPVETSRPRPAEPRLTAQPAPAGPRLGPANR